MKPVSGFTLIELIIVIIIVGILASVAAPMLMGSIEDSRGMQAHANLRMIATAARMYWNDTGDTAHYDNTVLKDIAAINAMYNIEIQDAYFDYEGDQEGNVYTFTATRNSGSHLNTVITINQTHEIDPDETDDWPWIHE